MIASQQLRLLIQRTARFGMQDGQKMADQVVLFSLGLFRRGETSAAGLCRELVHPAQVSLLKSQRQKRPRRARRDEGCIWLENAIKYRDAGIDGLWHFF
jgi:hypothetical protein